MNINEIPHHLFFYKGKNIADIVPMTSKDGLNYIICLLDYIYDRPTKITTEMINHLQEYSKTLEFIEPEYGDIEEDFIEGLTDINTRLDYSCIGYLTGKILQINTVRLILEYYDSYNTWITIDNIKQELASRATPTDKMALCINSKLSPVKAAELKNRCELVLTEEVIIPKEFIADNSIQVKLPDQVISNLEKLKEASNNFFFTSDGERLDNFTKYSSSKGCGSHNNKVDQLYELTFYLFKNAKKENINQIVNWIKSTDLTFTSTSQEVDPDWMKQFVPLSTRLEYAVPGAMRNASSGSLVVTCCVNIARIQYAYFKDYKIFPARNKVISALKALAPPDSLDKYSRVINKNLAVQKITKLKDTWQYILKN